MDKRWISTALLCAAAPMAMAQASWVTMGEQAYAQTRAAIPAAQHRASSPVQAGSEQVHLLRMSAKEVDKLARLLHGKLRHCGGFMVHADEAGGRIALARLAAPVVLPPARPAYVIANQARVEAILAQMDEKNVAETIVALSAFPNRYYASTHGAKASVWLREKWMALGKPHAGISVEAYTHPAYKQASVIATIAGTDLADEVIVIGAHLDSINTTSTGDNAVAPGADDDASGVAGLTEILRALAVGQYKPRRTIKLIAYAAEEVGLRGSQAIARDFKEKQVKVMGVLQLDMTNYKGSEKDIYLISDYTDAPQNRFIGELVAAYLPAVRVDYDKCGYACSDHAAWDALGYPASMPFEAKLGEDNPAIHTKKDTYANMGSQAAHAMKFTKMAAAYAVELGSGPP